VEARELYQAAIASAESAQNALGEAQETADKLLNEMRALVARAESARQIAIEASGDYKRAYASASDAASHYLQAKSIAIDASEKCDNARGSLEDASARLDRAIKQHDDASGRERKAEEALVRAENIARSGEKRLDEAVVQAQKAEGKLREAERCLLNSKRYALSCLIAAISIALWGFAHGIARLEYGSIIPITVTIIAVVFCIFIWRKAR
jgi:tetratricopeptide (TPR) repeat protein